MNDRFKFRGWHKELKQMSEVESLCPYEDATTKNGEVFLYLNNKNSYYFPEEVEVMQCTGLKDKNGKLIYEGDIVKTEYTTPSGIDMEEICTVNFDRCAFWINKGYCAYYLDNENCIYEIIGNIYENKDLLNENS